MVKILPDNMDNPFENDPFPNGYLPDVNEDKLFKHVVFHTDKDVSKVRVTAIGHNWTTSTESEQKVVVLSLHAWDSKKDNIRIKAVLNPSVDGIKESHWVQLKFVSEHEANKKNQFRVRAVSDQGWRSKWVYSELRDDENDLIAFELLYDLMDVLLYTHEHDLETLLDSAIQDTFTNLLYKQSNREVGFSYTFDPDDQKQAQLKEKLEISGDSQAFFDLLIEAGVDESSLAEVKKTYLQPNESKKAKIEELSKTASHLLRKEFREMMHSSPIELFELAKMYQLIDRHQTSQVDFVYLVLEAFLEDRYEKVIEETEFRALLSNDEEMYLLLQSIYDFDVKSELIRHAYNLGLDDHFVTVMNDAVKLISEPLVYENLNVHTREETFKFLRMAFQEVFVPFLVMEQRLAELETDLFDKMSAEPNDQVIEYSTTHSNGMDEEDYLIRHLFLEEMFEMLLKDVDIDDNYYVELLDRVINMVDKDKVALFIYYDPIEFIEVFSKISEGFKYEYKTLLDSQSEELNMKINESIFNKNLKNLKDHNDFSTTQLSDEAFAESLKGKLSLRELLHNKTQELHIVMGLLEQSFVQDPMHIHSIDQTSSHHKTTHIHQEISQHIALQLEILNKNTTLYTDKTYSTSVGKLAKYENLYRINPLDNLLGVYKEYKESQLDVDRLDDFFETMWNLKEEVIVYLGDLGGVWPLGHFILGTSTLRGDPSNPDSNELGKGQDPNQYI